LEVARQFDACLPSLHGALFCKGRVVLVGRSFHCAPRAAVCFVKPLSVADNDEQTLSAFHGVHLAALRLIIRTRQLASTLPFYESSAYSQCASIEQK
jgi:hypothetical protein